LTSYDEVNVNNNLPDVPNAGIDQTVCTNTATLLAESASIGIGLWSVVSGQGDFSDDTNNNVEVSNIRSGINRYRWTLSNSGCDLSDDVLVTNNGFTISAGTAQSGCFNTVTLSGDSPLPGTGLWESVTSSGDIVDETLYNTVVNNLDYGSNTFRWTVTRNSCSSTATVVITNNLPSEAVADAVSTTVCNGNATLKGNIPVVGIGTWTKMSGNGTVNDATAYNSTVSGLSIGTNRFRWTINNSTCSSSDEVEVTNNYFSVNAGDNQALCSNTTSLLGDQPTSGTGLWTVESGNCTITHNTLYNTQITGLMPDTTTLKWTITINGCSNSNTVKIVNNSPSTSYAGVDSAVCFDTYTMKGNNPTNGIGTWQRLSGSGTITNNTVYNTTVVLSPNINKFRWEITKNGCQSIDDVIVTNNAFTVSAGNDQSLCVDTAIVEGTPLASSASGLWEIVIGSGTIVSETTNQTAVHNLNPGSNTLRWTTAAPPPTK